ncbi:hypothetical protein EHRUM4_07880, partial [Ehrlichia ruminantium]
PISYLNQPIDTGLLISQIKFLLIYKKYVYTLSHYIMI